MDESSLAVVPQDVLKEIFSRLDPLDRLRCAPVCRRWRDVANDANFWDEYLHAHHHQLVEHIKSTHEGRFDFRPLLPLVFGGKDVENFLKLLEEDLLKRQPSSINLEQHAPFILRACRLMSNPYFWICASPTLQGQLNRIHGALGDFLFTDDIAEVKTASNELHDAVFRADVSVCTELGLREASATELNTWYEVMRIQSNMRRERKILERSYFPRIFTTAALFVSGVVIRTSPTQHLTVGLIACVSSLIFLSRWKSLNLIAQVIIPLISIHPAFQPSPSGSVWLSVLLAAPLVHFRPLIWNHVPWYTSILGAVGFYSRIAMIHRKSLVADLSTNQSFAAEAVCNGLITPLALGFIMDFPKEISLQLMRRLPGWAPRFCLGLSDAIMWWNQKVERLDSLWPIFIANLRWMTLVGQEERDQVDVHPADYSFTPGGRKGDFLNTIVPSIAGFAASFVGRWIQHNYG